MAAAGIAVLVGLGGLFVSPEVLQTMPLVAKLQRAAARHLRRAHAGHFAFSVVPHRVDAGNGAGMTEKLDGQKTSAAGNPRCVPIWNLTKRV